MHEIVCQISERDTHIYILTHTPTPKHGVKYVGDFENFHSKCRSICKTPCARISRDTSVNNDEPTKTWSYANTMPTTASSDSKSKRQPKGVLRLCVLHPISGILSRTYYKGCNEGWFRLGGGVSSFQSRDLSSRQISTQTPRPPRCLSSCMFYVCMCVCEG